MDFTPTSAIVTGSDSGIGRATAVALATAGCNIGGTWHSDQEGAEETARLVRAQGVTAAVAILAALWIGHAMWQSRHRAGRDIDAIRARERRGF